MTREQRRLEARRRLRRQRALAAGGAGLILALVLLFAVVLGGPGGDGHTASATRSSRPAPPPQLPRGGRVILPGHAVVAYYGAPGGGRLGILGGGRLDQVTRQLRHQAGAYNRYGRPVWPAFELISTVATGSPGADGLYRARQPASVVQHFLNAARRAKALFIIDVQPGRSDFLSEVAVYDRFLRQPDVSLALDPEWSLGPGQIPGQQIGSTDAASINAVSAHLAAIVAQGRLPQKLLIVHQFVNDEIRARPTVVGRPGLALALNIDGFGDQPNKISKYNFLTAGTPLLFHGFKLFYQQDLHLMTPREVMHLRPRPDLVVYQ